MLRELIKKIKGMNGRQKEGQILMARLAKAEAAADVATKIIHSLHFASGCESADWRTEQIEGCATFEDMADELIEAYSTKAVYEIAWPGFTRPGDKDDSDCEYAGLSPYDEDPTSSLDREFAGREVLGGEWNVCEGAWDYKVKPNGSYVEGCAFWCCSDCSGIMMGPNGEKMADWDMHPYEINLYFPGCMYPQSLCNPHEPGGTEACRDIDLLLRTLEERALECWPDLVLENNME